MEILTNMEVILLHPTTTNMDITTVENTKTSTRMSTKLKNTELHMLQPMKAMRVTRNQLIHQVIKIMKIDQLIISHHMKIIIQGHISFLSYLYLYIIFLQSLKHSKLVVSNRFFHKIRTKYLVITNNYLFI